jgi:hypothetical protein
MQRGAEAPIFPAGGLPWPVLLFSHGLSGSPLSGDYIEVVKYFASHGYVVVAPFHGDLRFADIELDSFRDVLYALSTSRRSCDAGGASLSLTSRSCSARPSGFHDHVDAGTFTVSRDLGAESLMLMGAQR